MEKMHNQIKEKNLTKYELTKKANISQITLILNDTKTTIANGNGIKLKGSINYRPTNLLSSITLMRLGSKWFEVSRTEI